MSVVEGVDGTPLAVRRWPAARLSPSVPVLATHGLASNARTWDGVARHLQAAGREVAAVDLRGHGASGRPEDGYDFATITGDLRAVLEQLGWSRALVVGQSTGGNLAVELASTHPDRVAAVVGVDGGLIQLCRRWPEWEDCALALAPPALAGTPAREIENWLRTAHPDWDDEAVEVTMANFEVAADGTASPHLARRHHMSILRGLWEHRPLEMVGSVGAPALFLMADTKDDWAESKRQEAAVAQAVNPSIRIEWISPADHDVHVTHPAEVARIIDSFIANAI